MRPEPEELLRLAEVVRARPVIFESWMFCLGRKGLADAAQGAAAARGLAEAIATRAVDALVGGSP